MSFIITSISEQKSRSEIMKNATVLAQAFRTGTSLFSQLPAELNVTIAAMTANPIEHNEDEAKNIAYKRFS